MNTPQCTDPAVLRDRAHSAASRRLVNAFPSAVRAMVGARGGRRVLFVHPAHAAACPGLPPEWEGYPVVIG